MSCGSSSFTSVLWNVEWSTRISPVSWFQSMREPWARKKATSLSRSVMAGTFRIVTGSSVSSVAQKIGRMEFLFPDGVTVPERGLPPLTMRSAMVGGGRKGRGRGTRKAGGGNGNRVKESAFAGATAGALKRKRRPHLRTPLKCAHCGAPWQDFNEEGGSDGAAALRALGAWIAAVTAA